MAAMLDAKRSYIIEKAMELFLQRPVEEVTVTHIAQAAGVGEATIYRYFGKKQQLVVLAAARLWDLAAAQLLPREDEKTGLDQLAALYGAFRTVFRERPQLYAFIFDLDTYLMKEPGQDLAAYEAQLQDLKDFFDRAYTRGLADGSVQALPDPDLFYFSTTHALMNLCKKLAVAGNLTTHDRLADKEAEIQMLIDIILYRLKK